MPDSDQAAPPAPQSAQRGNDFAPAPDGKHLVTVVDRCFDIDKTNRRPLEQKWDRNYSAYRRDPTLDGKASRTWNRSEPTQMNERDPEGVTDSHSLMFHDASRQKAVAAVSILTDVRHRNGRLPFVLNDGSLPAEDRRVEIEAGDDEQAKLLIRQAIAGIDENTTYMARQMKRGQYLEQMEMVYLSGAVVGQGYAKKTVVEYRQPGFKVVGPGVVEYVETIEETMAVEYKSVWNIYRDFTLPLDLSPHVIETDKVPPSKLRGWLGQYGYIDENILTVLKSMNDTASDTDKSSDSSEAPAIRQTQRTGPRARFKEFWGLLPRRDVEKFERQLAMFKGELQQDEAEDPEGDDAGAGDEVECVVATANDIVIRFARTQRDQRPYYDFVWEPILDGIGGQSVCDNVEMHQIVLNDALRALEDTGAIVSKIILAGKRRLINGDFNRLRNGMFLDLDEDAKSVNEAVQQFTIDGDIDGLLKIIDVFRKLMDEASMLPRSEMGLDAETQQTMFEFTERLKRAGKYLGGVNRRIDAMEERILRDLLRWNMLDENCPTPKGNYTVESIGYSTFQNVYQRAAALLAILDRVLANDQLGAMTKLRYLWSEAIKANDIDPQQALKSAKELQEEAQAESQLADAQQAAATAGGAVPTELVSAQIEERRARARLLDMQARSAAAQEEAIRTKSLIERATAADRLLARPAAGPAAAPPPAAAAPATP